MSYITLFTTMPYSILDQHIQQSWVAHLKEDNESKNVGQQHSGSPQHLAPRNLQLQPSRFHRNMMFVPPSSEPVDAILSIHPGQVRLHVSRLQKIDTQLPCFVKHQVAVCPAMQHLHFIHEKLKQGVAETLRPTLGSIMPATDGILFSPRS